MDDWKVGRQYADGSLPSVGTYGVPACWPHIRDIYAGGGLVFDGHLEIILIAGVDQLPEPTAPPITGLTVLRSVGDCGTRFSALLDGETVGNIEVETDMTDGGTRSRFAGWGDIGNLHTAEGFRRQGVGTWLMAHAAHWLRLGRVERLLAYVSPENDDEVGFLNSLGFQELTRTERGWSRASK